MHFKAKARADPDQIPITPLNLGSTLSNTSPFSVTMMLKLTYPTNYVVGKTLNIFSMNPSSPTDYLSYRGTITVSGNSWYFQIEPYLMQPTGAAVLCSS